MRYYIVHKENEEQEKVYHLQKDLVAGRSESCHILVDLEGVSRRHCCFTLKSSQVFLEDMGSTNGTYLNGTRIREAVVRPGDRIVIGSGTLTLIADYADAPSPGRITQLLGQTTIDTLLAVDDAEMPESTSLIKAGLKGDALKALYQLTEIVNSASCQEELLAQSVALLMEILHMDLATVFIMDSPGATPESVYSVNDSGMNDYRHSTSVLLKVLSENVSVIASDALSSTGLFNAPSIAGPGTACIMCVPMRVAGRAMGAVYLSSLEDLESQNRESLRFLTAMAAQIALALENLSLVERLKRDNRVMRASLARDLNLVGSSSALAHIKQMINRVAATNATVLITGESGTGKELIASAIHDCSSRKDRPMVSLNCGAIPEAMVESELFGHEKGAFTGAGETHIGKFELASEGTLFLDEIGELPTTIQVKLLRALEQRNFYRVGGEKLVRVDVRIIAATNADLEQAIKAGKFREDLLFRLKVFVINAPPLRDHVEDIPELVRYLLDLLGGDSGFHVSDEGMRRLQSYDWPGNVRELRNVLEREIILSDSRELHILSMDPTAKGRIHPVDANASLKEAERAHIIRVLRSVGWNKKAAAEVLGIGRPSLYDRIKQYAIQDNE